MNKKIFDIEERDLKIVQEILQKHLSLQTHIYAFGSRVKGNAKRFSDLDLAIDSNGKPLPSNILVDLNFDFEESDLPYKVDIVDLNNISDEFRRVIEGDCQIFASSFVDKISKG